MVHELQKASVWKRISASLADLVLLVVVIEGLVLILNAVFGFESYIERRDALEEKYIVEYGIDRDMTEAELDALSDAEREAYMAKVEAATWHTKAMRRLLSYSARSSVLRL